MLKRSWSETVPGSQGSNEDGRPCSDVIDLSSPPPPLHETTNAPSVSTEKKRKFDASWAPFTSAPKRTSSAPTLDALVRPLAGAPRAKAASPAPAPPPEPSRREMSRVFLSSEQQRVLELVVKQGRNIFFTGSAGTGKSVLLRYIIADLKQKYKMKPDAVAVTASTGIAACNVGGTTLHSFGGVGLAKESPERLLSFIRRNRKAMTRWMRTSVLVIDEISMIDPKLFEKLETIARLIRKSPKPFGGIQLVVTGDFFQLPPVSIGSESQFVFESAKWRECIQQSFNLTQVFRQKDSSTSTT